MTELEQIVEHLEKVDEGAALQEQAKDPRKEMRDEVNKEMKKYAKDFYVQLARASGQVLSRNLDPEAIQKGIIGGINYSNIKASNLFYSRRKDIFDSQLNDSQLEKIAGNENVVQASTGDDRMVLSAYFNVQQEKNALGRYERGEILEDDQKRIQSLTVKGAVRMAVKRIKDEGEDDDEIYAIVADLAEEAALRGYYKKDDTKSLVTEGLRANIDVAERLYRGIADKLGRDVYGATRDIGKKMTESKDVKEFGAIMNAVYQAAK